MTFKLNLASLGTILLTCSLSQAAPLPTIFLDRVVAIGMKQTAPGPGFGNWIGEASGFIYGEFDSKIDEAHNRYSLFLVTNRHVIEDHIKATSGPLSVRLNPKSGVAVQEYDFPLIVDGKRTWHVHPDPTIDIAVVSINGPAFEQLGVKHDYFRSESDLLSRAHAKELGLTEGYGVFVLGFPMGLVGALQDYVIVREGSIARVRDTLEFPDRAKSFLIDSFVFPGNSGGPVVLKPEAFSFPGEKARDNTGVPHRNREGLHPVHRCSSQYANSSPPRNFRRKLRSDRDHSG